MSCPTVSIITPAYNAAAFIRAAMTSVRSQTLKDWEMIVADDGSKDNTVQIVELEAASDSRIKLIKLAGNFGPAAARNAALSQARGRFIAFLDSDDLWLPEKLDVQVAFMKRHRCAISFSQYRRIDSDGSKMGRLIEVPHLVTYPELLKHNVIGTLTAVVDSKKTGPLQMRPDGYDDFILWLSILKRGFVAYGIQRDLARYRIVSGSVSHRKLRAARWVWHIYRKIEGMPLPLALLTFCTYAKRVSIKHRNF